MISGDRSLAEGKRGAFYNTLEEFHKYWERIDIICPRSQNQKSKFKNQNYNSKLKIFDNVYLHESPWSIWLQPFWILKKGREIYHEQKFDLMTVHEYPPFYNGIGARLLWNKIHVPYVLEIHHIPGYPRAADFKEWFYKKLVWLFIKHDVAKARAVRVVNQHQVPEFLIKAGVSKEKIAHMPSFYIDLNVFKPADVVKKYDFIFVGRLAKNKGIDLLLEAAGKLKFKIINFKLLIVGDGPEKENLKFKIYNLKLHDNVVLYGWAKDSREVAQLLNQSKILIMPSYNEGGPRVALEAMACGVPVLATPVGIVPDLIKNGETGAIIDWDPQDISQKAAELLENNYKYQKYSKIGMEIANHFEKKDSIKNYAQKLQKLLSTGFTRTLKN